MNDPDFIDLITAWHENSELPPERRQELLDRLADDETLRRELAREIQMAGLTRAVQAGEPRWLRLQEKLEAEDAADSPETEDAVMAAIEQRLSGRKLPRNWQPLMKLAAGLVMAGLFGAGVVWASIGGTPKAESRVVKIANGDFESLSGPVSRELPTGFNEWGGDPAEVVTQANGNRVLRFVETSREQNEPDGLSYSCDVAQFLDLRSLRSEMSESDNGGEWVIELTTTFFRDTTNHGTGDDLLAGCTLLLFDLPPDDIARTWPSISEKSLAKRWIRGTNLNPGDKLTIRSGPCIIPPEASLAMIRLSATLTEETSVPVSIGDCYVDNVEITLTHRPILPVRMVK